MILNYWKLMMYSVALSETECDPIDTRTAIRCCGGFCFGARRRFMTAGGHVAKEFYIMPQTFVLPQEYTHFVAAFTGEV